MFNLFKKTLGIKSYLGVDIGTTSIKVAEVGGVKGLKPTLINYGVLEGLGHLNRTNNAIQTSSLKMLDKEVVELLRALLKDINPKTKDVIASLPAFSTFTTLVDMPSISPSDMAQAIRYQARALVPMPITEITLDWLKVNEFQDDRGIKHNQVLLISVPNDTIIKYQKIFSALGLNLRALEVEGLSLARILTANDPKLKLIVDIGGRSTSLSVAGNGTLRHLSQIDFAGGSLTQALAIGLNINFKRAEELKKQRGLTGTGGEYELASLMAPFLDAIVTEAKRVKYNFEKDSRERVESIVLSGGGANLKGIEDYFSREFQLPAVRIDLSSKINFPPSVAPIMKEISPIFTVAFGLAVREL